MAYATLSIPDQIEILEGESRAVTLGFIDLTHHSFNYSYRISTAAGTASAADIAPLAGSGAMSIMAIPATSRSEGFTITTYRDGIAEAAETAYLEVQLGGDLHFADGTAFKSVEIVILDNNKTVGTDGDDVLYGTSGADLFQGNKGSDTYHVTPGDRIIEEFDAGIDLVMAGASWILGANIENLTLTGTDNINGTGNELDNILIGNPGNNVLSGLEGDDSINGGAGDDWLTPGPGNDTVDGGVGIDMVSYVDLDERVMVDLGAGTTTTTGGKTDTLLNIENVTGTIWADLITGDAGDNRLRGLGGYDWFVGSDGNDTYEGGTGRDTVSYAQASALPGGVGVHANLQFKMGSKGQAEGDVYDSIESLTGSSHKDWLVGSDEANVLRGLAGDDIIYGYGGNDTIDGGAGNDWLDGGDGNDRITGGAGNDTIIGGRGWDTAIYSGNRADYQVETWSNGWVSVFDTRGIDGVDILIEMNVIEFADGKLWL